MTAFEPLADEPRWVAWRNEVRRNKPTKVPHSPHGGLAKADDPATWGTRAQAEALAAAIVNGTGGGIGIELGDLGADTYLAGIDLDSCIAADGCLALWAEKILSVVDTYAERSPSGTGVKVFFYASGDDVVPFLELIGVEPGSWGVKRSIGANGRDHGPAVEIYVSHRYFAVTGDLWPGKPERIALLSWKQLEQLVKLIPRKPGGPGRGGRDTSRSAKAFNEGARLRREGKTFEEMCAALRTHSDPDIASWCRDKGDLRQLRRIWDKAELPTAAPPPYSEEALALEYSTAHAEHLRYVALWGRWLLWGDNRWQFEDTLKAFDLARAICRNASAQLPTKQKKLASDIAKARTVAAIERLAKADRRHAETIELWDDNNWLFNAQREDKR